MKDDGRMPSEESQDLELSRLPKNDIGNSQRLITRFGTDLIYVEGVGWYSWCGTHWSSEEGERHAKLCAQMTAQAIRREAASLRKSGVPAGGSYSKHQEDVKSLWKWARQSGDRARLEAMLKVAAPHLSRNVDELDTHAFLLNVGNGTLVLNAREESGANGGVLLRKPQREDFITRSSPVIYDPNASAPVWRAFIEKILPDPDVRAFVQIYLGYSLTGRITEQCLILFYGFGANGKTTLIETVLRVFGSYGLTLPFSSLVFDDRRRGGEATPDLARLPAIRLAAASEPEVGARLSESVIKQMTGGDRMTVRHLNRGFFEFRPQFKLCLSFNNRPVVRGQDEGIWRRLRLVRFPVVIPEQERDRQLAERLWAERSGILNWLLDGLRLWLERGLQVPDAVRLATDEFRSDSDNVGQFLLAATQPTAGKSVQAADLYAGYCWWCTHNAMDPLSNSVFGRVMVERGYQRQKVGRNFYLDLEITDTEILDFVQGNRRSMDGY